ncbi:Retrovirus-related Pol polyprotein from transposon RE2 [Vitis vinifera]|uniref:Retrovirus-related Pol polyprotein from transposon RE2 n=1 Tax=Vitis vinifera TaxID=29760 RepID=A0A438EUW3_VITVI|nr:Retrovirus-related Pol polyprotein from transposon RE2 [Vitis vinifera]
MHASCLGFLVQWSLILSPTCAPSLRSIYVGLLKKVYHQDNDARRFQLEHAIAMFQHGSLSIQDYYSAFLTLWHEYADLVTTDVPIAALSTIQTIHATTRRDQFLMKLQQRLSTQAILEQSHGSSGTATVAYAAQGRGPPMHSKNLQCFCCKEYGHIAATCPKKFCSYCKKKGHIIKECRIRPQNRQAQAFQTSVIVPPIATSATHDSPSTACSVPAPPAPDYCTPEMVQQMLISALSAMGFQGNNSTKLCSLPIAAIGDASSKFTDVFLAPQLSTNLISVGQLVDNNCAVNFSDLSMVWHRRLGHPNTQILSHVLNSDLPVEASHCFDLIHSDVWGPSPISSYEKFKYYVTFIDDHSRFTWVYFLRSKSEVFRTFTEFLAYVDNQFSTSIKTLRTDSGGEYLSTEFQAFLASKGIIHQRSCPSTPQQNGVAERKNRHLLDVVRTLLLESSVPSMFWVEALKTATHLINRLPSQVLHMESPYFRLFAKQPSYDHLRIFGCVCFVHLPPHERHKLSAQSVRCAFLGYNMCQKGFVCYDPTLHRTLLRSSSSQLSLSTRYCVYKTLPPQSLSVAHRYLILPRSRCSQLQHLQYVALLECLYLRIGMISSSSSGNSISALTAALSKFDIPTCYSHAAKHDCWRQAMQEEIAALEANHTWDIEPCPPTIVPLGCKWVYSVKVRSDGSLDRYKARLVALGNNQEYGVNYEETFAPVAKMTTVRTILALAASSDWPLHQMDSKYDTSLFLRKSDMGIVVLLVYVDDIVITGSDSALLSQLKTHLSESFHMKDLGSLTYFLGLEVHHSPSGISLNQHKYASDLVATAGLQGATSVDTPMELNVKLRKEEGDLLADPTSQPVPSDSSSSHLAAVRRIIRYVQGTSTRGLFFPAGNSTRLVAYSDADWAGCADTRRSITGWCVFLGDALISWKSKKQDRVSKSSTESEYRAMSLACSEIIWLRGLLAELDFSETDPTPLHAIIQALFKSQPILSIMSAQSILKWTVTLSVKPLKLVLSLFHIFPLTYKLLISSPRLSLVIDIAC